MAVTPHSREHASESVPNPEERAFRTLSDEPVRELYTAGTSRLERVPARPIEDPIGLPGEYPFTRGIHPTMYRGRLWTMRQFAGFGTREETNERYHFLLAHGQTGLSTAFDMPTLMGYDSDAPRSLGEVGREGVAIDSLRDMETLFAGIDLGEITTSMTINGPAAICSRSTSPPPRDAGHPRAERLGGHDPGRHPQGVHRAEGVDASRSTPACASCVDMIEFCTRRDAALEHDLDLRLPHPRGGLDRGAGAGVHARRRLRPTSSRRSRAAWTWTSSRRGCRSSSTRTSTSSRRSQVPRGAAHLGARACARRYGAKDPRSWTLRFHAQTAGCSATAQQPENNIVRVAYEALAAVLGGTQSLHTNSMDEVLALPTEKSVEIALRTQQVLAYETNVTNVADPLGGSYFVEALTDEMERQPRVLRADRRVRRRDRGDQAGFFQREIADAAFALQRQIDSRGRAWWAAAGKGRPGQGGRVTGSSLGSLRMQERLRGEA